MKIVTVSIVCLGLGSIFFSCGDSNVKSMKTCKVKQSVVANRLMTAELNGLPSQKNANLQLKQELLKTKAVESCEFDIQSDGKINSVKVAFDKEKISADQIVEILANINDKQLKVGKVETQHYESTVVSSGTEDHANCESNANQESYSYETPNLLELFSRLVSG